MKVQGCGLFLMTVLSVQIAFALSFDTAQERCQDYVTSQIVKAIKMDDRIVLMRSQQYSEWIDLSDVKTTEMSFADASLLGLSLGIVRPVEFLKGSISARIRGCALFYPPDYNPNRRRTAPPIHYHPAIHHDPEICRLAFVRPQREPLKDRVRDPRPNTSNDLDRDTQFVSDARTLPSAEFLAKYNLAQVFATSVYNITQGCLFFVDHPEFQPVDEKAKKNSSNMFLSPQEVSEIVYLAYLHEDVQGGAAKYAEAVRQSRILQPMPKAEFKTLIGQRLHAALSDPEYGMAEKRAKEEKERKQRELAERWSQLRKQLNEMMSAIEKAEQITLEELKALETVVKQFQQLPYEKNEDDDRRAAIERDGNARAEKMETLVRYLKILASKEHENLGPEIRANVHIAWFLIRSGLKDPNFQVAHAKHYDDILRKVQELPLDPKQVKEMEDAVAEMEANRKKYAR